jgi:hypothetical protein
LEYDLEKPIIIKTGHEDNGGIAYALGEGRKGIRIDLVWRVHSEKQAHLHLSWNGSTVVSLERAEVFYAAFGEMMEVARAKQSELSPREFV